MCEFENEVLLTGIGNPNVDIIIPIKNTYFHEKFSIPSDGHTPVSTNVLRTLESDIKRLRVQTSFTPGGCIQNTLRVFQWLINWKLNSVIIGTIGKDEQASFLKKQLLTEGVRTCYTELESYRTSSVYIFTTGSFRSAVYDAIDGAAVKYSVHHLLNNKDALNFLKQSRIVLLESFFTFHSAEVGLKVLEICSQTDIIVSFNICGVYVIRNKSQEAVLPFVKLCDIVIGNFEEFIELCRALEIKYEDVVNAFKEVYSYMLSESEPRRYKIQSMQKYKKILVITNGSDDILCMTKSDGLIRYSVPSIDESRIKDTTGAGDSFMAGFLFGLLKEMPILKCLEIANLVAAEIIQQIGCSIPTDKIFNYQH